MSHRIVARSSVRVPRPLMRLVMAVLLLACSVAAVRAQTTSATVVGTVTDSSGARIAGGTVSIKDLPPALSTAPRRMGKGSTSSPTCRPRTIRLRSRWRGFDHS